MASKSKKLELVRKNKKTNSGKKRKAQARNHGTTKTKEALFGEE